MRACENCRRPTRRITRGLCPRCYEYGRHHGGALPPPEPLRRPFEPADAGIDERIDRARLKARRYYHDDPGPPAAPGEGNDA